MTKLIVAFRLKVVGTNIKYKGFTVGYNITGITYSSNGMPAWLNALETFFLYIILNTFVKVISPLNAELNLIRHFLALVGARHIVHVSRMTVNNNNNNNT
jgi:hypothetical protein